MNIEEIKLSGIERIYFDIVDEKSDEQLVSCKFKGGSTRKDNDSIYQYMYFYFTSIGLNITANGGVKIRFEIKTLDNYLFPRNEEEYWSFSYLIQGAYQAASIEFNTMCAGTEHENVFFEAPSVAEIYQYLNANNEMLFN